MIKDGRLYADGPPEEVITADNVRRVYGTSVWVRKHPTSGRPYILSTGSRAFSARFTESSDRSGLKVHVICGGGSGLPVFTQLLECGCDVTAGVINIGDSDQEAAESLGIEYVEDAPFSPVSEAAEAANWNFISSADVIVVAEVPFGSGNVSNLRAVVRAMEQGKRVAVVGKPESYAERDFMDGEVERLLIGLVQGGATALQTPDAIPDWVAETGGL
jgi:iron complex transport system ATP-binding protein